MMPSQLGYAYCRGVSSQRPSLTSNPRRLITTTTRDLFTLPANSRQVSSNQRHIHVNLATVVDRHLGAPYRRPPAQHSVTAYAQLQQRLSDSELPLILDSFCGTGHSTAALAHRYPQHQVVGIDKSGPRRARTGDGTTRTHGHGAAGRPWAGWTGWSRPGSARESRQPATPGRP